MSLHRIFKQGFSSISEKFWGSVLFKVKIRRKQKLHGLVFQGENNPKTFSKCQVFKLEGVIV